MSHFVKQNWNKLRKSTLAWRIVLLLVALILWQVLSMAGVLNARFFARPTMVVSAAIGQAQSHEVYQALLVTLEALMLAVGIGCAFAIIVGISLATHPLLRQAYYPIILLLLGTPKSVLLPVFVMLLGLSTSMAVAYGALVAFIQVTINVIAGMDLIERKHLMVGQAFGASTIQSSIHIVLPSAGPGIFVGLWSGLQAGFVGVLIAQLFGSSQGIGYLVRTYSDNFQSAQAISISIFVSVMVILAGTGWNILERRLNAWRPQRDV